MANMFKLSIGSRILYGFAILLSLYFLFTSFSYIPLKQIEYLNDDVSDINTELNYVRIYSSELDSLEENLDNLLLFQYPIYYTNAISNTIELDKIYMELKIHPHHKNEEFFVAIESLILDMQSYLEELYDSQNSELPNQNRNQLISDIYSTLSKLESIGTEESDSLNEILNDVLAKQQDILHTLLRQFIFFGIISTAIATFLSLYLTRKMVSRIVKLKNESLDLLSGGIDPELMKDDDEIGDLARTFNELGISLKDSRENLQRTNLTLESQVRERTKELDEKIEELEKFNKVAVGRELRMIELKKKVKQLEEGKKNNN